MRSVYASFSMPIISCGKAVYDLIVYFQAIYIDCTLTCTMIYANVRVGKE